MPIYRVMVVIPASSGKNEDAVVNNWGFDMLDTTPGATEGVRVSLQTFYDSWSTYRAISHQWDQARVKMYDLSMPKPRPPVIDQLLGTSASRGATCLPPECAVTFSFQGSRIAGELQRRRRGRVYLGPFGTPANNSSDGTVTVALTNILKAQGTALMASDVLATQWRWSVISTVTGAEIAVPVTNGWCDDAWDTVRRRGRRPTIRATF